MLKAVLVALLAVTATAKLSDFPRFDTFHSHCQIDVTYYNRQCNDTFARMGSIIQGFSGSDPNDGKYAFLEKQENNYWWVTRTANIHKYVDEDISFVFTQVENDCQVVGKSRTRYLQYYDYEANYCNIWNVFKYTDVFEKQVTSNCKWIPKVPEQSCV